MHDSREKASLDYWARLIDDRKEDKAIGTEKDNAIGTGMGLLSSTMKSRQANLRLRDA